MAAWSAAPRGTGNSPIVDTSRGGCYDDKFEIHILSIRLRWPR